MNNLKEYNSKFTEFLEEIFLKKVFLRITFSPIFILSIIFLFQLLWSAINLLFIANNIISWGLFALFFSILTFGFIILEQVVLKSIATTLKQIWIYESIIIVIVLTIIYIGN